MANRETLRARQTKEAMTRMQMLGIDKNVINDLVYNNVVYYSERMNAMFDGILYWLHNNNDYVKIKNDFEKENNALVYHAQLTYTSIGTMLSFLYVSATPSEWADDKSLLKQGDTYAYVYNLDDPDLSEIGMIGVQAKNGGITRTY